MAAEEKEDDEGQEWHEEEEDAEEEEAEDDGSEEEDDDAAPLYKGDDGGETISSPPPYIRRSTRVGQKRQFYEVVGPSRQVTPVKETRLSRRSGLRNSYREADDSEDWEGGYASSNGFHLDADGAVDLSLNGHTAANGRVEDDRVEDEDEEGGAAFTSTLRTYHQRGDVYEAVVWGRIASEDGSQLLVPLEEAELAQQSAEPPPTNATADAALPADSAAAPFPALVIRVRRVQREKANGPIDGGKEEAEEGEEAASEVSSAPAKPRLRRLKWRYNGKEIYRLRFVPGGGVEGATDETAIQTAHEADDGEVRGENSDAAMQDEMEQPQASAMQYTC